MVFGGTVASMRGRPLMLRGGQPLATQLAIATSAQRPRGPLVEQATALVHELLLARW